MALSTYFVLGNPGGPCPPSMLQADILTPLDLTLPLGGLHDCGLVLIPVTQVAWKRHCEWDPLGLTLPGGGLPRDRCTSQSFRLGGPGRPWLPLSTHTLKSKM